MSDIVIGFLMKNVFSIGLVISALIAGAWLAKGRKTISNLLVIVVVVVAIMYSVMHPGWIASVNASAHSTLSQRTSGASVQSAPVHLAHTVSAHHPTPVPTAKPVRTPKKVHVVAQLTQQHATQGAPQVAVASHPNPFTHVATLVSQVCGAVFLIIIGGCVLVVVRAGRRRKTSRRQNAGQQLRCSKCNQVGAVRHYQASRGRTQLLCNDCAAQKRATLVA